MTETDRLSFEFVGAILLSLFACGTVFGQSKTPSNSNLEILRVKWEKQVRLPRNFDPSVVSDNGVFSSMESRTVVPGSTQAPYGDEARRDAAARSAAMAPVDYFPKTPGRMPVFYVYSLTIRNIGTKTIQAVAWDYVFINATSQTVIGDHHLLSQTTIKASHQVTLKAAERTRPTAIVSAATNETKMTSAKPRELAVIQCVLYDDGTMWRNPARDLACELLKRKIPPITQSLQRSQH